MEEEPTDHVQRRQTTKTTETAGKRSDPQKDGMPAPHTENSMLRKEPEPVRTEPVIEVLVEQARPAGGSGNGKTRDSRAGNTNMPPSPADQEQAEQEGPARTQPELQLDGQNQNCSSTQSGRTGH